MIPAFRFIRKPVKWATSGVERMQCGIVEVSSVEDATGYQCRNDAIARCCDCDAHVCEAHAESCGSCNEVFCSTCLAFHQTAYHQKKPAAEYRRLRKSA